MSKKTKTSKKTLVSSANISLKNMTGESSDGEDFDLDQSPILKPEKNSEKKLKKIIAKKLKKTEEDFNKTDSDTDSDSKSDSKSGSKIKPKKKSKSDSDSDSDSKPITSSKIKPKKKSDSDSDSDDKSKKFIKKNKLKIKKKDLQEAVEDSSDSDTHTEPEIIKTKITSKKEKKNKILSESDTDTEYKQQKKKSTSNNLLDDSSSDSDNKESKKKVVKKTEKKTSVLKIVDEDKKKVKKQIFKKKKIQYKKKNEENILIIIDKEQSIFFKENILFNHSKNIKKNNIDILYYKTGLELIYKIINKTFEEETKKQFYNEIKNYNKVYLVSTNPLTIFLSLYLCKNFLFCIYESYKDINEILKQVKPNYEKEIINLDLDKIKENYLDFLHSNKKENTLEEKIDNEISIEIENLNNYYLINYFSGLNYIEEQILFCILENNLQNLSFNDIFSFINKKVNAYYELTLLKNFKNLIKKFNNLFIKTDVLTIKAYTNIEVNINKLKQIYFIHKNFEDKKKIILISILPIFYIDNTNYLRYEIKDIIDYFKNKFNKTNVKTYYEKQSNIEIDNTEKNVTLKFEIFDGTKINISKMNPFDKLALIQKCIKLKENINIENDVISFTNDIEKKRFNIQKKIFKNNINCFKNKIYTFGLLKEKLNEICLFYYENLCKYIFFIILINLYKKNLDSKELLEKILIFKNNKNYIYVFPFDEPKNIEKYSFDYLEEYINDFSLENFTKKEEEKYIELLLKSKYNSL